MGKNRKKKGNSLPPVLVVGIPKMEESTIEQIFQKLPIMGYTVGLNGAIVNANIEAQRRLGYPQKELIGMPLKRLYAPSSLIKAKRLFLQWKNTGKVKNEKLQVLSRKGEIIDVLLNVETIHDPASNPLYSLSTHTDITELNKAVDELRKVKLHQEAILASVPDIIMEVDTNKVYTWANKAGKKFFGKDVIGKEAAYYFEGKQKTYTIVQPLFEGSEDVIYVESWQRRNDGEKRLLAWWCRTLKDPDRKIIGVLSTARDITEQKRIEEIKDQFLNMASHELKSPLIPIKSQCQLLLDEDYGALNKEQKEAVEMIFKNEGHLERLATDVLDVSRARSNKLRLVFKKADICKIVRSSITNAKGEAKKKGITFSSKCISALPHVFADIQRIHQVMANLLGNALKYTPENGAINIRANKTEDGIQVSVHDTGIGMDKGVLEKIFLPFFQADSRLDRKYGGVGLGLSICKGIIEAHGGKIWGESGGNGKGSTFTFTLPFTLKNHEKKLKNPPRGRRARYAKNR